VAGIDDLGDEAARGGDEGGLGRGEDAEAADVGVEQLRVDRPHQVGEADVAAELDRPGVGAAADALDAEDGLAARIADR